MGGFVGGGEQAADAGVQRLAADAGDDTAGCLGDGDGGGEVDVVAQVALVDVRRPAPGRQPGQRQRRRADAGAEPGVWDRVAQEAGGLRRLGVVEVDVDEQ